MQVLLYEGEIAYEPSALLLHDHRDTIEALSRQMYAYGSGFSAALTSLVVSDWRQIPVFARLVLPAAGRLVSPSSERNVKRNGDKGARSLEWTPLARKEIAGLAAGPFEYLRSRARAARRSRSNTEMAY
jgi:hypothetical protein